MSFTPIASAVMGGCIGRMTTGIIFGTNRLINSLCAKFPLVVWVASFGSLVGLLFGSFPVTTNFLESLIASTCLLESFITASTCFSESFIWSSFSVELFLNQFLASTCSSESFILLTCLSESLCAELMIVDWIVRAYPIIRKHVCPQVVPINIDLFRR